MSGEEESGPAIGVNRTLLEWHVLPATLQRVGYCYTSRGVTAKPCGDPSVHFTCGIAFVSCLVRGLPRPCLKCDKIRTHEVPGATEKFRSFFEKYTPDPGLRERRSKMYGLRSKILHGSDLMQLDQGRAFGWDPPWWNERELNGNFGV